MWGEFKKKKLFILLLDNRIASNTFGSTYRAHKTCKLLGLLISRPDSKLLQHLTSMMCPSQNFLLYFPIKIQVIKTNINFCAISCSVEDDIWLSQKL